MKVRLGWLSVACLLAGFCAAGLPVRAQEGETPAGGWVCGQVVLENGTVAIEPQLKLAPADRPEEEAVAEMAGDARGHFCFKDQPAGFYDLYVRHTPWPRQAPRRVEVRAGLVNRLTPPTEVRLEPGEPSVRFEESFDGMPQADARALFAELVSKGDQTSLAEAARRFLPKRGVAIDVNRLLAADPKALVQALMRQLEERVLPPLKTSRYIYLIGELGDPRIENIVIPFLLGRMRDGRILPKLATMSERPTYVSDIAVQEVARYAGKDFKWKYGLPPLQNQSAINRARDWWRNELAKKSEQR